VPAMVSHDAFYVSHALEPVQVPRQELVNEYLPPYSPPHRIDPQHPESWGNVVNQEMFNRHRRELAQAMDRVPEVALEADREWGRLTGRSWGVLERYRCDGARTVLATMGSMCGTARDAVDAMRDAGRAVGLLKLRLFRPLPVEALRAALAGVPEVIVLDRNYSPGHGGVLHQELRAALYGMQGAPRIHGLLAGVGGVNVSAQRIAELVAERAAGDAGAESVWVE
jgi:pyruvate/2-oxoacid:ferredoxin oxidoreductase alpha subunit